MPEIAWKSESDWKTLSKGDVIRVVDTRAHIALEGRVFEDYEHTLDEDGKAETKHRVELGFSSPTLSWLEILGFKLFTQVKQPTAPVADQYEVDRHAEKQGVSYADAWRYFERNGYDMSQVRDQY